MSRRISTILFGLAVAALCASGCSSPKEKLAKCQEKCDSMKGFAKSICTGVCERRIYGEFEQDKLLSLCDKDSDHIACVRYAIAAGKSGNKANAASALQACCDKGQALCCGVLGKMYRRGKVLDKDETKGFALLEKACTMGDATSCASPGLNYMRTQQYKKSMALFEKGCAGDAKAACGMLGVQYRDGKGVARDVAKAKKYLGKSCRLGYKTACKVIKRL